jgi:hypothetical protein
MERFASEPERPEEENMNLQHRPQLATSQQNVLQYCNDGDAA